MPLSDDDVRHRAQQVAAFVEAHGRMPRLSDAPDARRNAQWLADVRHRSKVGRFLPRHQEILDATIPQWRDTRGPRLPEAELRDRAARLAAFHRENGRWPSTQASDPEERSLGHWRNNMRSKRGAATAILDELAPGWRGRPRVPHSQREVAFRERARALARFVTDHGRWPSTIASGQEERELAWWWAHAKTTDPSSPRGQVLDAECPAWRERRQRDEEFVDRIARHRQAHGTWPSSQSTDKAERELGAWLERQRARRKSLPAKRRALLDQHCAGWDERRVRTFEERVQELAEFATIHHRWPSTTSGDPVEEGLAWWHHNQRRRNLHARHVQALDAAVPGWRERAQPDRTPTATKPRLLGVRFLKLVDELRSFYARNGRAPHRQGRTYDERRLAARLDRLCSGVVSEQERHLLDDAVPGWALRISSTGDGDSTTIPFPELPAAPVSPAGKDMDFEMSVARLSSFWRKYLRQPSPSGGTVEEQRLGRWLKVQRAAALDDERRTALDAACPGWATDQGRWGFQRAVAQCQAFVASRGRFPDMRDLADFPQLVWWFTNAPRRLTPEQAGHMDSVLPGWRDP